MGDSDTARVGDIVLAIGNPFGLGGSLSVGVVSARNRNIDAGRYDDFIQTDAAINRGNSGGPLFNTDGEVIGVNTAIVSPTGAQRRRRLRHADLDRPPGRRPDHALRRNPSRLAGRASRQHNRAAADRAGYDGATGAVVTRITPNGPAAAAGLRPGDVVLRFNGQDIPDSRALTRMVGEAQVGSTVAIDIVRDGRRMQIAATIERLEETDSGARVAGGEF